MSAALEEKEEDGARCYDAIFIGSGIGSMTTAVALAREKGWRCLLLEQALTLGGMTHEFSRRSRGQPAAYHFDVGIHYIGEMAEGELFKQAFDYVTSDRPVEWMRMPEVYERFMYPGMTVEASSDPKQFESTLAEAFPREKRALRRYFKDVSRATMAVKMLVSRDVLPGGPIVRGVTGMLAWLISPHARKTTQAYLDKRFKDPKLKAVLTSQWGDFGLPPSRGAFGMHALIVNHFLRGSYYPRGGAHVIAKGPLQTIRSHGGDAIPSMLVEQILTDDPSDPTRVTGVRARRIKRRKSSSEAAKETTHDDADVRVFRAPVVVSSAGAAKTFTELLGPEVPVPFREDLLRSAGQHPVSAVSLFLGLRQSPASLGYEGGNFWVFGGYDHDENADSEEVGRSYYLSFPSLKNPDAKSHTAEMISFIDPVKFRQWAGTSWGQRGAEYEELKERLRQTMLQRLSERHPGLVDLVVLSEVATPLTYEYFQRSKDGAFYQLPFVPERFDWPFVKAKTPVRGLYLTGADVFCPGMAGAMAGGLKTFAAISGFRALGKLMRNILGRKGRQAATGAEGAVPATSS